ncbi:hypothetical protein BM221_007306 [Beauveria bassiana]|uniref:Uncharacterized protein n=1 Tax=Beauveria bassiana TaxID=176275 RepID=A0A2N6NGA5_BEABA|nr:hypothetical protein BM221_007306 [Beauveria bassiana]
MGADSRKIPPLPAPTETDTATPTELATDITTDVSKPGDEKSTYSLPEDGTPVTIRTRGHKANKSQTSLLIEYFEGGKVSSSSAERKPSVRVRLTPSKKGKGDHFQVTETKGSRKISLTRRIPLDHAAPGDLQLPEADDTHSMTSYASATEESNVSRNPIDIEIERSHRRRRPASPLIPSEDRVSYQPGNPSEISAIPTDSFLDGTGGMSELKHSRADMKGDLLAGATATALAGAAAGEALHSRKTRSTEKERSSGLERPKEKSSSSDRKRRSKSRTGSMGENTSDEVRSPRRRSSRTHQESTVSGGDSSLLSSNVSAGNRSVKSSASKSSSINNPKLLETVEDAIRRLILPELSALKREQSKREARRSSIASTGTSVSKDDGYTEKRRSSGQKSESKENIRHKEKRNREARHDYENISMHSPSQDSLGGDYTTHEEAAPTPQRGGNLLRAAAAGAAGAMAAKGISSALDHGPDSLERKQRDRRRRRADHSRSRSVGRDVYVDDFDDDEPAPPMPLMKYVEEYETDEFGRKIPVSQYDYYGGQASREPPEYDDYIDDPYSNNLYNSMQDVPPPLKYVPYQAGARGLSPIPSVSGYTEGGSEAPLPRTSKSMQSVDAFSSPEKSPDHRCQAHSIHSIDSLKLGSPAPQFAAGQEVRGISANPNVVNPPLGVESAVASLVDGSMIEQSVVTGMSGYDNGAGTRESALSYDEPEPQSRNQGAIVSPDKLSIDDARELEEEPHHTPTSRSLAQSQEYSEYDLDDQGRKVPRARYRNSPTASEAAITAGAVGAAAAALKAAQGKKQADIETYEDEDFQPAGVNRNRSFKERAMGWKPRETPTHSVDNFDYEEEDAPRMTASGMPDMGNPMPEIGYHLEDDIITNPSLLNEPMDRDIPNWESVSGKATPTPRTAGGYEQASGEPSKAAMGLAAGAAALGAAALAAHNRDQESEENWGRTSAERKRDTLITNPYEDASPIANHTLDDNILDRAAPDATYATPYGTASPGLGPKYDEGYMSNGPNRTPDIAAKTVGAGLDNLDEDPFYVPNKANPRHMSGFSQGMESPFYDAAMGAGIERIENKDIVALMQHLMVRDAQRSARDTEIVALLMNAAVEMRNSFREMKELVQDTGDDVIFSNVDNTEKLQKAINGPRPFPGTATRSLQSASQAGTLDEATKKKNLWKRALQGLSAKGTNDLSRIEDMLVQLLGEVDVLKSQTAPPISSGDQGQSLEHLQPEGHYEQDKGYEPEGNSTPSHASVPRGLQAAEHKYSDHRISTVQEDDDEYEYDLPSASTAKPNPDMLLPGHDANLQRGGSVPPEISPQTSSGAQQTALSADNTPRSEKGKKHKSNGSSGWIPKISRWSETTASSVGRAFRGSGASKKGSKYDEFQPPSRSGSSLASYDDAYVDQTLYGVDKLHTGFSNPALNQERAGPAQPTVPSFALSEDPKYKAHRNSVNLQHPQPRQGQTERHQAALEHSAREYDNPMTPRSTDWAGSATSLSRLPGNTNRYSASSGATREADYALSSPKQQSAAPPRPPKEPLDASVHTPVKGNRVASLQKSSPVAPTSYESGYGSASGTHASQLTADGSPKLENRNLNAALGIPARRPSGPRAMTPKSPEEAAREERRRKRDTFGTVTSQEADPGSVAEAGFEASKENYSWRHDA